MEIKRCSGYKGVWKCEDDYPDHMVPVGEFGKGNASGGLHGHCRRCKSYYDGIRNPKNNPIANAISAQAYKMAGGYKAFYALPKDERLELRSQARFDLMLDEELKSTTSNVVRMPSTKPKFDDGRTNKRSRRPAKRPSKRTGRFREGPGYVYIYQDERIPADLKIGASKDSEGRLEKAGTWGCYRCLDEFPFKARYAAEEAVHALLDDYRLYSNKEIFRVTFEVAVKAIQEVAASENSISEVKR